MQPQTDAEMIAWNYGVEAASWTEITGETRPRYDDDDSPVLQPQTRAAFEALGVDLFYIWADRGYAAAVASLP